MKKELIERIEVGAGGAASIEFTDIPQDGVDLLLVTALGDSVVTSGGYLKVNTVTTNLSSRYLEGSSSIAYSGTNSSIPIKVAKNTTANNLSSGSIYILNYTSSSAKPISQEGVKEESDTTYELTITAGVWDNTAPITSLSVVAGNTFAEYSSASLYKVVAE